MDIERPVRNATASLGLAMGLASVSLGCGPAAGKTPDGGLAADGGADIGTANSDASAAADEGVGIVGAEGGMVSCTFDGVEGVVDAGQCEGGQLVAAPTTTITTPDPEPSVPTLASTPAGDRFLAVWADGGGIFNGVAMPESIWASVVQPGPNGVAASAPVELTGNGTCPVATWNGAAFTVAWAEGASLRVQQVDVSGALLGSPAQLVPAANARTCPTSLTARPAGIAIAWLAGESQYTENVALIASGDGGAIQDAVVLDTVGPGVAAGILLAELEGQTYAAYVEWPDAASETAVRRIDWSQGVAIPQTVEPGFLDSFLAADGRLWLATEGIAETLYAGVPGGAFQVEGQGCDAFGALATDACGRLVGLGNGGYTPAGIAVGFFAQDFASAGSQVALGDVTQAAIAGGGSNVGVLWFARIGPGVPLSSEENQTGALSFTTLSWR
jgi:hypothetical protein